MGLKKWFEQNWVDIGSKKPGGGFRKCGRSKLKADRKRKYPKCVPAAKAAKMTKGQIKSAVQRKRSKAQGVGGKPTNVKTIVKKIWVVSFLIKEELVQLKEDLGLEALFNAIK